MGWFLGWHGGARWSLDQPWSRTDAFPPRCGHGNALPCRWVEAGGWDQAVLPGLFGAMVEAGLHRPGGQIVDTTLVPVPNNTTAGTRRTGATRGPCPPTGGPRSGTGRIWMRLRTRSTTHHPHFSDKLSISVDKKQVHLQDRDRHHPPHDTCASTRSSTSVTRNRDASADRGYPSEECEAWLWVYGFRNRTRAKVRAINALPGCRACRAGGRGHQAGWGQADLVRFSEKRVNLAMTRMATCYDLKTFGLFPEGGNLGFLMPERDWIAASASDRSKNGARRLEKAVTHCRN